MRSFCFLLLLLLAIPASAQLADSPYPVERGERVRATLASADGAPGPFYVGSVLAARADTLELLLHGKERSAGEVAWPDVARVERVGENRTGEAVGLLIGGLGGALAGYALAEVRYALAEVLSESSLAGVGGAILGGFGGLLAGGIIGSRMGNRWQEVAPARPVSALRVVVPLGG